MTDRYFTAYGKPLALNPQAFGMLLVEVKRPEARDMGDGVHVVDVRGPLMHHADPFCDSYDAIKSRVLGCIGSGARKVVLSIDSPGGLVSGCFDTADEIRAACDASGVELIAYVDGQATSAAYALACVASKVFVPSTGIVGSIGVIDAMIDATNQDAMLGLTYSVIASGARKTDGNPHVTTTDAARVAAQDRVDSLASIFFDHVASRRGVSVEKIASLQAGLLHGQQAVDSGLADAVATLDQVLQLAQSGGAVSLTKDTNMANPMEDAIAALRKAAEGDDEEAAKAKRMLAALDGEPDGDEKKNDEPKSEEGDGEKKHDEPDGDEAKSSAIAALAKNGNTLEARVASLETQLEGERKAALRTSRPDVAASVHAALSVLPLAQYQKALSQIEKPKRPNPAATATVQATRGADQNTDGSARLAPSAKAELDARMGLSAEKPTVKFDGITLQLGVMAPATGKGA